MMEICHCTIVQTHRMCNTTVNHKVNNGLWVIMMCQCKGINCSKGTTLVGASIMRGTMQREGPGMYGKPLYQPVTNL